MLGGWDMSDTTKDKIKFFHCNVQEYSEQFVGMEFLDLLYVLLQMHIKNMNKGKSCDKSKI